VRKILEFLDYTTACVRWNQTSEANETRIRRRLLRRPLRLHRGVEALSAIRWSPRTEKYRRSGSRERLQSRVATAASATPRLRRSRRMRCGCRATKCSASSGKRNWLQSWNMIA